ncbi:MAG: hypothetical protein QME12_06965 [Nanoarchaeota archaeon]|nr:hypothetical protein [Nanoarchaeota archaeon]
MSGKRGQVGLEYVMIVGAILLITIPLFFYALYETNYKVKLSQADDTVNTLANAADEMYSMGPGSKKYVWISLPSGVLSTSAMGKEVSLTVTMLGSASDFTASTKASLVGSFPSGKGTYRIAVESLESGFVRIGENYNDTSPPVILRHYPKAAPGELACPGFVTLAVDTDEPSVCKYSNGTDAGNYSGMPFFFDGRGLTHVAPLYLQPNLDFAFYARCIDPFGNVMNSSTAILFSTGIPCGAEGAGNLSINLSDEQVPPVVHLITPPDGFARNFSWVDFSYTVFDANSSISYCLIIASGLNYIGELRSYFGWQNNPSENATNNMTLMIDKGNYTWYVNCTDSSTNHNVGRSVEIWSLRVTKTFAESFLNSCAGKCGFAGYTDGACRQNEQKCREYPGGVWKPEFDPECKYGGSTGDFCCCFNA